MASGDAPMGWWMGARRSAWPPRGWAVAMLVLLCGLASGRAAAPATFTNPVVESGADPWVIQWGARYVYCRSAGDRLWLHAADRLTEIGRAPGVAVWAPPPGTPCSKRLWAPELHHLQGRWYIYVAADAGDDREHRMYVLERAEEDPRGLFTLKGRIASPDDHWAIDGSVLSWDDGRRYFIWSGWPGDQNGRQELYIALMATPWSLAGPRVRISTPELPWECIGHPLVNEGPQVLRRAGRTFVVYSASGSWTDDYALGLLELTGADPLEAEAWRKHPQPVFARTAQVFGPGHASFVRSPDGREDWIVYHAAKRRGGGWDRNVRMQPFGWHADGTPAFGAPVTAGVPLPLPSGTHPDTPSVRP